jgi:hypothetical protein
MIVVSQASDTIEHMNSQEPLAQPPEFTRLPEFQAILSTAQQREIDRLRGLDPTSPDYRKFYELWRFNPEGSWPIFFDSSTGLVRAEFEELAHLLPARPVDPVFVEQPAASEPLARDLSDICQMAVPIQRSREIVFPSPKKSPTGHRITTGIALALASMVAIFHEEVSKGLSYGIARMENPKQTEFEALWKQVETLRGEQENPQQYHAATERLIDVLRLLQSQHTDDEKPEQMHDRVKAAALALKKVGIDASRRSELEGIGSAARTADYSRVAILAAKSLPTETPYAEFEELFNRWEASERSLGRDPPLHAMHAFCRFFEEFICRSVRSDEEKLRARERNTSYLLVLQAEGIHYTDPLPRPETLHISSL